VLRRTTVFFLIVGLIVVIGPGLGARPVLPTRAEIVQPFPMCGPETRFSRCIEAVYINDQQITPSGDYGGGLKWFQGPKQDPSEPNQYPTKFIVSGADGNQETAFGVAAISSDGRPTATNPQWKIRLVVDLGDSPHSYAFVNGRLEGYVLRTEATGDQVVDVVGWPAARSWYDRLGAYDPIRKKARLIDRDIVFRECIQPAQRATTDSPPSFGLRVQRVDTLDTQKNVQPSSDSERIRRIAMAGMAIAGNYGCGETSPIPQWQPSTKALTVTVAGPHFTTTGSVNTGYFHAILPASYIINVLGISIAEALTGGVSLTMNSAEPSVASEVNFLPDGSIGLQIEGFHYSKRRFVVKPHSKTRLVRSSRAISIQVSENRFVRGSATNLGVNLKGVGSETVHAYLIDQTKSMQYIGSFTTTNGSGSLVLSIPNDALVGRGSLLFSCYQAGSAKRALLRTPISIRS